MARTRTDGGKMMKKLLPKLLDTLANNQTFRKLEICSGKRCGRMPVSKEQRGSFQRRKTYERIIMVFCLDHVVLKMYFH